MGRVQGQWARVNGALYCSDPDGSWWRAGIDAQGDHEAYGSGPRCACEGRLVWRGRWSCEACGARAPQGGSGRRLDAAAPPEGGRAFFRSLLETNCDRSAQAPEITHDHAEWLAALEWLTSPVRYAQARRLAYRGYGSGGVGPWYRDRMRAQAARFARVRTCGALTAYEWHEPESGAVLPHRERCGQWRVCSRCRRARQAKLTTGVTVQRELAMRLLARERGRRYAGREGRWSERLVTLTVPHSGDLPRDTRTIVECWRAIEAPWRRHLRSRGATRGQAYARAIEVTEGAQRDGHAHLHVWVVGPYLEHALLRAWWGEALLSRGYAVPRRPLAEVVAEARDARTGGWLARYGGGTGVPWPVVDVRRGSGAAGYTTKVGIARYTVKSDGAVELLDPEVAARVYEALEGRRAVQWARGWAPRRDRSSRWHLRRAKSTSTGVFVTIRDDTRESSPCDAPSDTIATRGPGDGHHGKQQAPP